MSFMYKNGRFAKLGDVVVNQITGQKTVVTSLHEKSAHFIARSHFLHADDHDKKSMPRKLFDRINRVFK